MELEASSLEEQGENNWEELEVCSWEQLEGNSWV